MPAGAAVVVYEGKRGRVFRIKYQDAAGRQVMETLGPERDGWTARKAKAELRESGSFGSRGGVGDGRPLSPSPSTRRRGGPRANAAAAGNEGRFAPTASSSTA